MKLANDFQPRHFLEEYTYTNRDGVCYLCSNKVSFESSAYYCPACELIFHKDCLTVTYPKIHEHTLTFIHRNNSFICDACGTIHGALMDMFGCLQCNFFVHKNCIFLPRVIKITCYPHRLSHTFCILSDGNQHCGVCRKIVHKGYGGYTCIDKVCNYVIHSKCATDSQVWDGKDVEGEHEEVKAKSSEVVLASFLEIDGRKIRHFSHDHDLTSLLVDVEEGSGQVCQACTLPIEFGEYLTCKQCDFYLHETCARLPRTMEHLLHRHPLTLQVYDINMGEGFFICFTCKRYSCGFMYQCCQEGCRFQIDVRCASFVEPFIHSVHPQHPLFLRRHGDPLRSSICAGCDRYSTTSADCGTCFFALDLACITLPKLVKHKYDIHPLTLSQHETFQGERNFFCEICEEGISKYMLFYTCQDVS